MDDIALQNESPEMVEQPGPKSDIQPDRNGSMDISSTTAFQVESPTLSRPGISRETLLLVGIKWVSAEEAFKLCGIYESGIWIPYLDIHGNPIIIKGKAYGRLRLDKPIGDMKYYQAPDTGSRVYMPWTFLDRYKPHEFLYLAEGEFKCLSIAEEGYQSAALPGFYGYAHGELLPELKALLDKLRPSKIYFIGDNDTCLNFRFSIAAVKLAELVSPIPIYLPRLPLNGPKGIDDLKETLT